MFNPDLSLLETALVVEFTQRINSSLKQSCGLDKLQASQIDLNVPIHNLIQFHTLEAEFYESYFFSDLTTIQNK